MDQIGETVIYIDATGKTHEALVFGQNVLHPNLLDLVYVDENAPANDNIKKVFAIDHHEAKKETNPDLPAYPLNAWKEYYENHQVIPPDHPNFDHKFAPKVLGLNGQPLPTERPLTDAFAKTHKEMQALSKEDSDELAALSGSGGMAAMPDPRNIYTASALRAPRPDTICAECGNPAMAHTIAAAKGDVAMDHDFVEKVTTPPDPPPTPVTSTEDLQKAIEGITDKTGGPTPETPGDPTVPAPQQDGDDPPNCQPGQLC